MTSLPRFYPILDTQPLNRSGLPLVGSAEAMLDAGVRILQLRHKGHFSRELFDQAKQTAELCHRHAVLFVINDRADMAALLGASLHVGQQDLTPTAARKVVPAGTIIGLSTHNESQFCPATHEPVDYLAIGPIFATGSKENPDPVVGTEELHRLRPMTHLPVVAIGGITRQNAYQVWEAGTDSVAVIGDLFDGVTDLPGLRSRCEQWLTL